MEKLEWVKNIFGGSLTILRSGETVGQINWNNIFSSKAQARFRGKTFYITRDIWASRLEVLDAKDQSLLARLAINPFSPRSEVILNGKRFELEMKNFWQSGWSWKFNRNEIITFISNEFISRDKGNIELFSACNEEVEILILLGLALRSHFILVILILLAAALLVIL